MTDYAAYQSFAVDSSGNAVPNASIEVRSEQTGNLATLFSGRTGGALANPFTADSNGYFIFYAAGDFLKIRVYTGPSGAPTSERFFRYQPVGLAAGYDPGGLFALIGSTDITGAVTSYGLRESGQVKSDVTTKASYYNTTVNTQATSFTLTSLMHFEATKSTFGAGSLVTNQYGFYAASSLTGAAANYGFYSDIAADTNSPPETRWNFYGNGTARNYMAGALSIGATTDPGTGGLYVHGAAKFNSTVQTVAGATFMTTAGNTTITGGFNVTPFNNGTKSSGTFTPDALNGNYQYYTNNGAHTLAAPGNDSAMDLLVTNGASAGAITFSGFTVSSSVGDALTTTNTHKFVISIRRINSVATYTIKALQ